MNELGCMEESNDLFANPYYDSPENINCAFAGAVKEARNQQRSS